MSNSEAIERFFPNGQNTFNLPLNRKLKTLHPVDNR